MPAQTPPAPIAEDRMWPEVDPQTAFKAWLVAIADAAGKQTGGSGWVALAKRVSDVADTWDTDADRIASGSTKTHRKKADELHDHAKRLRNAYTDAAKTYRNWPTRGLPRTATVETAKALTTVANQLEVAPPHNVGRWTDFPVLMDTLMAGFRTPADGPSGSKNQALAVRSHNIADLLTLEPTTANALPLNQLQLGSSRCGGDIPHYVPRDIDTVLADRLNDPETHMVVLVGPPKAGKTRTLVHALTTNRPDALIWWANCAPGMLPKLVEKAEREVRGDGGNTLLDQNTDLVVVLDDLHRCGTTPGSGLTTALLARLMEVATVVATLHDEPLARWRSETIDHTGSGEGATPGLADLLVQHRVDLLSELNADEESQADTILKEQLSDSAAGTDRSGKTHQLRRLGEYLASVDALVAKARQMQAVGGYPRALLTAACDAAVMALAGVEPKFLSTLTRWAYATTNPTQMWSEQRYEDALDQATTPLAPGSPHAVIVTTPDGRGYTMMDAVAVRLDLADRDMTHLLPHAPELGSSVCVAVGQLGLMAVHLEGMIDAAGLQNALKWFQSAANLGDPIAMFYTGVCLSLNGDSELAYNAYKQAAINGNTDAMVNLSVMLAKDGDQERSEQWLRRASRRGSGEAAYRLSNSEEKRGNQKKQIRLLDKAARRGHGKAAYKRWRMEISKNGTPGEAFETGVGVEWLHRAASASVPLAKGFYNLYLEGRSAKSTRDENPSGDLDHTAYDWGALAVSSVSTIKRILSGMQDIAGTDVTEVQITEDQIRLLYPEASRKAYEDSESDAALELSGWFFHSNLHKSSYWAWVAFRKSKHRDQLSEWIAVHALVAQTDGIKIPDDVISYIATNPKARNIYIDKMLDAAVRFLKTGGLSPEMAFSIYHEDPYTINTLVMKLDAHGMNSESDLIKKMLPANNPVDFAGVLDECEE